MTDKADIKKIKSETKSATVADCLNIAKQINSFIAQNKIQPKKVAILSNFTLNGLSDCLVSKSFAHDICIEVYSGEYGQWQQEIMGERLYNFKPDIIFLVLDVFGIDHQFFHTSHALSEGDFKKSITGHIQQVENLVEIIKSKTPAHIVVTNISDYWPKVMSVADHKLKNSARRAIMEANIELENYFRADSSVSVFDFDGWLGHIGKERYLYGKFFYIADMKLSPEGIPLLAEQFVGYIIPLSAKTKKCIVLDLDNTLWGGIVGEDGINGIKLAPSGIGYQFFMFQKLLLGLHSRGVILAINSKNNIEDAMEIFERHPYMILKSDHFAAKRINWQDKVTNMKELAEEINVGLDSMVFIDDDLSNRSMVIEMLPEVTVLELPKDPYLYHNTILNYKGFNSLYFTDEDRVRGDTYLAEKKRRELLSKKTDLSSFLHDLGLTLKIEPLSKDNISRAAQLTQKTNQFNLTTRRYQESDLLLFLKNGYNIWTLSVGDRFGDYGVTGLIIVKKEKERWVIDDLLLSCRVLGKDIEKYFVGFVLDRLKKIEPLEVLAHYIPTAKNAQVKDFYGKVGFGRLGGNSGDVEEWIINLKKFNFILPSYITINNQ